MPKSHGLLMNGEMVRALTVSQPFAGLIAYGQKFVENRRWETLYRCKLLIHAGKGEQYMDRAEMEQKGYVTGCVLAVADLTACLHIESIRSGRGFLSTRSNLRLEQIRDHAHTEGPFCWILENVQKLTQPVPCRGAQGLWMPTVEVLREVERQVSGAPSTPPPQRGAGL